MGWLMDENCHGCERVARIEEGIDYLRKEWDEFKKLTIPLTKRVYKLELSQALFKNDKKWIAIIAGAISGGLASAIAWMAK